MFAAYFFRYMLAGLPAAFTWWSVVTGSSLPSLLYIISEVGSGVWSTSIASSAVIRLFRSVDISVFSLAASRVYPCYKCSLRSRLRLAEALMLYYGRGGGFSATSSGMVGTYRCTISMPAVVSVDIQCSLSLDGYYLRSSRHLETEVFYPSSVGRLVAFGSLSAGLGVTSS